MARHSNPKEGGYVTQSELLNMGNSIREYLKHHKEPFIDKNGARVYEWENKDGVRFRIVTKPKSVTPEWLPPSLTSGEKSPLTKESTKSHSQAGDIITFYSDRNFNEKMKFKNPKLNQTKQTDSNPLSEFGKNYQEFYHKGKEAIKKLLQTKSGQVQGAFYKKGLGDIDLVWGDEKMGLKHILDKHPEVIDKIPEIVEKGDITKGTNRVFLDTQDSRIVVSLDYKGKDKKCIITGYYKDYSPPAYPH